VKLSSSGRGPVFALVCFVAGCGTCDAGVEDIGQNGGNGAGNSGANNSGGSTSDFLPGGGGPPGDCTTCSADLHQVLDCDGNLIQECPADTGCGAGGTCVPACQSAAENKSTIGCEFYSMTPAAISEARGSCFAVMIANTWTTPITLQAEYGGTVIDAAAYTYVPQGQGASLTYQPLSGGMLGPGQLGIMFLSSAANASFLQVDCPVPEALSMLTDVEDGTAAYAGMTGIGNAFHVQASAPVVAYDVYPWGGSPSYVSSATLLIPSTAWSTNYVTADAWDANFGNPFTQVVAAEDNTTVTFVPVVAVNGGGGLPGGAQGAPITFSLNRGQTAQFLQPTRLAGSVIDSDKPIGVWGGSSCMNVPSPEYGYCDAAHQQILGVQNLGNEYVVARYPARGGDADENAPVTFIGVVDGTTLVADPPLPGVPATLNRGQVVTMSTASPFSVKSQDGDHPFYVAAYMTGSTTGSGIGDPEYVNIVPPLQYLDSYLFATDPTYRYTSLVFKRKKDANGLFQDVNLDCMGPVTGWVPVGTSGQYEVARFNIVNGGAPVGACDNGVHTATSAVPFGLSVWGYDVDVSYGYPAGMSVKAINTVIVPPVPQ
jgi:hypothetical protein